jgi:hypothetical protein
MTTATLAGLLQDNGGGDHGLPDDDRLTGRVTD